MGTSGYSGYWIALWFFFQWSTCFGQVTIWSEDFNSYADGTTIGDDNNRVNPAIDWLSGGCLSCPDSLDDWWEVRSGVMEARDVNQLVFLQTEVIDISGFRDVQFSLDIIESGDLEGPYFGVDRCQDQTNEDFVNVWYRVDRGPWVLIPNFLNWCGLYDSCGTHTLYGDDGGASGDCRSSDVDWGSVNLQQIGLQGSTLEIRLETINSSTDEFVQFDNLMVRGTLLLPVTLLYFESEVSGQNVHLRWETANETNNHYFQVERTRLDQVLIWEALTIIPGAGNSHTRREYRSIDHNPHPGRSFYRIKQVDYDGHFSYSPIAIVAMEPTLKVYPNPVSRYLFVRLEREAVNASVRIFNVSGQELFMPQEKNGWSVRLDLGELPPGLYTLCIRDREINTIRRVHLIPAYSPGTN